MIIFNKITKTEAYVELTTENGEKHIIPTSDVIFVNDESGFVSIKNTGSRKTIGLISEEEWNRNPDEPSNYKVWGYLTDGSVYVIQENGDSVLTGSETSQYRGTMATANIGTGVTSIAVSAFFNCTSLTSVTIGSSVTSIGTNAFDNCSSLTSVIIPNSVTSIGRKAFSRCSSLTSVTILATTPPTLGDVSAFYNTNNCPIYVPDASVDAYKAAPNWRQYADRIKPMSEYQE